METEFSQDGQITETMVDGVEMEPISIADTTIPNRGERQRATMTTGTTKTVSLHHLMAILTSKIHTITMTLLTTDGMGTIMQNHNIG